MEMGPVIIWRSINIALALIALIWLLFDLRRIRFTLTSRRLYLTFSLAGLLLATVIGSMAAIKYNNPAGMWTAFTTASCVWCIIGLWVGKDD